MALFDPSPDLWRRSLLRLLLFVAIALAPYNSTLIAKENNYLTKELHCAGSVLLVGFSLVVI